MLKGIAAWGHPSKTHMYSVPTITVCQGRALASSCALCSVSQALPLPSISQEGLRASRAPNESWDPSPPSNIYSEPNLSPSTCDPQKSLPLHKLFIEYFPTPNPLHLQCYPAPAALRVPWSPFCLANSQAVVRRGGRGRLRFLEVLGFQQHLIGIQAAASLLTSLVYRVFLHKKLHMSERKDKWR